MQCNRIALCTECNSYGMEGKCTSTLFPCSLRWPLLTHHTPHTHTLCCLQLDEQLGSELQDNWGLDVLVRVGETWLPKLQNSEGIPHRRSGAGDASDAGVQEAEAKADVPLLKLLEFLTASLCLYVIEEDNQGGPLRCKAHVYSATHPAGADG